jgi:hypothetical protein
MVLHLGLPGHPELPLSLFTLGGLHPGPGLLGWAARRKASLGADSFLRMTTLRGGERGINGADGEEHEEASLALRDGMASSIRVRRTVDRPTAGPRRTASDKEARPPASH